MTIWDKPAYEAGKRAFVMRVSIDDNPYDISLDDFKHDSWQEGWIHASQGR